MSALFDGSPGTIFASAADHIVYFELVSAISVLSTTSDKDEKHVVYFELAFPRGGGGCKEVRVATDQIFATIIALCTSDNYL